jgi:hypothetical protein
MHQQQGVQLWVEKLGARAFGRPLAMSKKELL